MALLHKTVKAMNPAMSFARSCDETLAEDLGALITCAPHEHEHIAVHAPWTGALIGHVPRCDAADVQVAITRARAAQRAWAKHPYRRRARIFLRFHDLL